MALALVGLTMVAGVGVAGAGAATTGKSSSTSGVPPAVAAEAKAALLTLAAFPSGWATSGTASGPSHAAPLSSSLASCLGASKKLSQLKPETYSSPDFTNTGKTLAVEDSVSAYSSSTQAQSVRAALGEHKLPTCMNSLGSSALQSSLQQEAGSGTTVGKIIISGLPAGTLTSDEAGFKVTIPLTAGGKRLNITSIQVDIVNGKVSQQLTFNGNGTSFPAALEAQLVRAALNKTP